MTTGCQLINLFEDYVHFSEPLVLIIKIALLSEGTYPRHPTVKSSHLILTYGKLQNV